MKCKMGMVLFLFCFLSVSQGADLQTLADSAAESVDKTLRLESKTYYLDSPLILGAKHSGLKILGADGGGTIISCGRKIEGWTRDGDLWKAHIPSETYVSSLYINGVRARPAQTPNADFFFAAGKIPAPKSKGGSNLSFIANDKDIEPLLKMSPQELENVRIEAFMAWIQATLTLESIERREDGKSVLKFKKPAASSAFYRFDKSPRFKILNYKDALDKKGEFYFDKNSSTVFYLPRKGEDMENAQAFYPLFDTAIYASGDSENSRITDVSIENIVFEYGSYRPDYRSSEVDKGEFFAQENRLKPLDADSWANSSQGATCAPSFINFDYAKNISIKNCEIRRCDGYAITLGKSVWDSEISNCEISDTGTGGIRIGIARVAKPSDNPEADGITSGRVKVMNNIIYGFGRWHKSGIGIMAFDVGGSDISNNEIFDGYYSGISVGWVWGGGATHTQNNKINRNKIHDLSFAWMSDLGGIYTLGSSEGSEIIGNFIWGITCHEYGGWGIYNDEGSRGFIVSKNYVRSAQQGGYFMHYGSDCKVENNFLEDSEEFQVGLGRQGEDSFSFERNIVLYSSPALLFRLNNPPDSTSAKFDKNIYFNRAGKVMFGKQDFAQWKASGRDAGSFEEPVDTDAILKGARIDKIGFEPLEIDKAGVQGAMKSRLDSILKDYKMPKVRRTQKASDLPLEVSDDFVDEIVGSAPQLQIVANGESFEVVSDPETGKALRVIDKPAKPEWMPYFFYRCRFLDKAVAEISFKFRISESSKFNFDVREIEGKSGMGPCFNVANGKLDGSITLPIGKWISVKMEIPVNDPDSKGVYIVKVSEGDKVLFEGVRNTKDADFQNIRWVGSSMTGNESAATDWADFKIKAK